MGARGWDLKSRPSPPRQFQTPGPTSMEPPPQARPPHGYSLVIFHMIDDVVFQLWAGGGAAGLVLGRHLPRHPDDLGLKPRAHVRVPRVHVLASLRGQRALTRPREGMPYEQNRHEPALVPGPGCFYCGTEDTGPGSFSRGRRSRALGGRSSIPGPTHSMPGDPRS